MGLCGAIVRGAAELPCGATVSGAANLEAPQAPQSVAPQIVAPQAPPGSGHCGPLGSAHTGLGSAAPWNMAPDAMAPQTGPATGHTGRGHSLRRHGQWQDRGTAMFYCGAAKRVKFAITFQKGSFVKIK